MTEIDVSVIIPTFHRELQLKEAIASVHANTGVELEIIVLDDSAEGSAFDTVLGVKDSRLRYIKCDKPSQGRPALVRNQGAQLARGRYLHFLDDDDLLESDALAALAQSLDNNPDAGMAFGVIIPFGNDPQRLRHEQRYFRRAARIARALRGRMHLVANLLMLPTILVNSSCMARRECFIACGGYDAGLPVCEDVDLWMRIVRASDFVYLDRPILHYRTGAPSLMTSLLENDERLEIAWRRSQDNYREQYGRMEWLTLKLWARVLLRATQ
ncbi:MAG TPA: glycosyltransferase [Steroidobacteraceae bacterium]|jgi:glycosyltransferase involved in cell wall biosynthesis